jgi:predicted Fe-Mo cluster-binding NifX family protein
MDPRFGRAAKFVIYDTETKETTVVDNEQNMQASKARHPGRTKPGGDRARVLITGNVGPKAFAAAQSGAGGNPFRGICHGREALDAYGRGS